jgi:septum site-determining protein MinC
VKVRGIRSGVLVHVGGDDDGAAVDAALDEHAAALAGDVAVEVAGRVAPDLLRRIEAAVDAAGGTLTDVRPPAGGAPTPRGETVVVGRTVRSGARVESTASLVVIGDVNAGAELLAADDIIVLGTLRGLAHAGAAGNDRAVVWAQRIASRQLRIGAAVAQADGGDDAARGPELAMLRDGQIVIRPWSH